MATWYAQGADNVNINAAGRWNSLPGGGGMTLTWPPDPADILVANGKLTRVNVSTTVAELQNDTRGGATASGWFIFNTTGVSLTANAYNSASATGILAISLTSGTVYFVGNLYAGPATNNPAFQATSGSATINITGNLYGGDGSGTFAIGTAGTYSGNINITGNVYGGSNITNSQGIYVNSSGPVSVTGNAIASANSPGAALLSSGVSLTVSGYAEASTAQAGATNAGQGTLTIGETRSASNGRGAVLGAFRFASATAAKSLPMIAGTQHTLSVLDVAALVPTVEDVRAGVVYGDGAYTGTLALQRKRPSMAGRF